MTDTRLLSATKEHNIRYAEQLIIARILLSPAGMQAQVQDTVLFIWSVLDIQNSIGGYKYL